MAKGRIISTYVALDPDLNALSIESTLAYLMCIPHLDRDGLIDGRPTVLWAKACPLRPELLDKFLRFIQEWEHRGLIVRYEWKDGPVLWFKGFRKHNRNIEYTKEQPSPFPPPPGQFRSPAGLIPMDPSVAADVADKLDLRPESAYRRHLTGRSHRRRDAIEMTSRSHLDQLGAQDQDQDQTEDQDQFDDDDGAPARRFALTNLALEYAAKLPTWTGTDRFIRQLDDEQLYNLVAWIRLYELKTGPGRYSPNPTPVPNPFKDVQNPVGKIITQVRQNNAPPMTDDDHDTIEQLIADITSPSEDSDPTGPLDLFSDGDQP